MAESPSDNGNRPVQLEIKTSPAYAVLDAESTAAADAGVASEDEPLEAQEDQGDDAITAVAVSISREQIRLTSPKTPAAEKAAAIERAGGFFGGYGIGDESPLVEEPEGSDEDDEDDHGKDYKEPATLSEEKDDDTARVQSETPHVPERSPRRTPVRLPSPWRADASAQRQEVNRTKAGLLDGLRFNRRRASTGPETKGEGWQKWLLSNLPSRPKQFSLSSPFSSSHETKDTYENESGKDSKRSSSGLTAAVRQRAGSDDRIIAPSPPVAREAEEEPEPLGDLGLPSSRKPGQSHAPLLRRSTSDQSLLTQRTLSTTESLGDDSRFEHVQNMANSRLKAIRDSWQDSSIKMPSLSNFNVSSFTPDFMRDRSGSLSKRPGGRVSHISMTGAERNRSNLIKAENLVAPQSGQPYDPPEAGMSGTTSGKAMSHPHLAQALEQLEGDIIVLGGYRGSILHSAEPPHRQLWVPVKVGLNLRKADLEVGVEDGDDERACEKIIPGGMLTHIGPVDMARRLLKRLRSCQHAQNGRLRVHDYGYDWRLDPNYLSKQLLSFVETLQRNGADVPKEKRGVTVIAHSLGGLITRHAVNKRPELFRGVVYAATPTTCVNILGPMRNGDDVLFSNRVLTAQVNFTIRTSFALLPLNGRCFFDKTTKEEYPVDFFDPQTWIELRLSPCVGRPLPSLKEPEKPSGITAYVSSMASALPSLPLPGRKSSLRPKNPSDAAKTTSATRAVAPDMLEPHTEDSNNATESCNVELNDDDSRASVSTAVTIPREKAVEYLTRTLTSVKKFKQELAFNPLHAAANLYPPVSVIYGKSTPTVYGAKVDGKEGIKHADAYDQLAFASGDGVVLARAAMVPHGYKTARGGVVSSERGHVTLLSDLEAVGKCLIALGRARDKGIGLGR